MVDWLRDTMLKEHKIEPGDLEIFTVTDDPQVAVDALVAARERLMELAAQEREVSHGHRGVF
jgi:predicted Rossmann-fold nucleotide-binding protein